MYYTDYISSRIYSVAIYLYISTPISPSLPLTGRAAPSALPAGGALSPQSPREWRPLLAAAIRALLRSAPPSCSAGAFAHLPIPHTWWPWQQRQAGSHRSAPTLVRGCFAFIMIGTNLHKVNRQQSLCGDYHLTHGETAGRSPDFLAGWPASGVDPWTQS